MDGPCHAAADAEDSAEEIRARAEVGDGAEEFERVTLFLEGVGFVGGAEEGEGSGLDFPLLSGSLTGDEAALDLQGSARGHSGDVVVAGDARVGDHLNAAEAGTVIQFEERKRLRVAPCADPSGERDGVEWARAGEGGFDGQLHGASVRGRRWLSKTEYGFRWFPEGVQAVGRRKLSSRLGETGSAVPSS